MRELVTQAEVARERGRIMARYLPPKANGAALYRPLGINPYPVASPECDAWERGYWREALTLVKMPPLVSYNREVCLPGLARG
jgi:hypothetical protein